MTAVHVADVHLYLYDDRSDYTDMGDVGCAVVATPGTPPVFRLGCYKGTEYLCTAEITPNNDSGLQLALQGQGYVSFRDDQSRLWSMHFATEHDAVAFGAHVAVAMYGASNMPDNRIICCDVAQGKRERPVYGGDRVKARYQSWVVSRDEGVPRLGSRLESNESDEKPYIYSVPANHNSVAATMLGFEGMTVGMGEEGRRFVVVPQAAKRGKGPAVHTVYMIYVIKKKDNFDNEAGPTAAAPPAAANPSAVPTGGSFDHGPYPHHQPHHHYHHQAAAMMHHDPYLYGGSSAIVAAQPMPTQVIVAPPQQQAPQVIVHAAPAPLPAIEQPPQAMPVPPPAGFNLAQMETIQRMRDLVGHLSVAIRDVTGAVDMFSHDFKQHDTKQRPTSLLAAQMDHSLRTLLAETDEMRAELAKRDETLNGLEERNKQLQAKADKFAKTAQLLADERKATLAASGETKVDLDQNMLSLQARLTRVLADREDVSRHLATVKRLLEVSDQEVHGAKQKMQIAEVTLQTNEAKIASTEEALQEERARRKLLEAKIVTLGDDLRAIVDDFRMKDAQVDDRRRQMQADKLHYATLMDDERSQAAHELLELRQELIDELAVRDRRYQEERVRVAKDSFERGRFQGIDDGEKEAMLEADGQMTALTFEAHRHRSELETVKVRLRQVHEQAAADRRRLEAQLSALSRVVDDVTAQNTTMETELHALEAAKETVANAAYEEVRGAVLRLSRPVGKADLRQILHALRVKQDIDTNFEFNRAEEEQARSEADIRDTKAWVRRCLTATAAGHNPHELPPPLRWLSPQEPPVTEAPPAAVAPPATVSTLAMDPASIAAALAATEPSIDMAEVERRQKELLAALHANNPALELAPPPPPPRTPTPPRRSPTPLKRPDTPPAPPPAEEGGAIAEAPAAAAADVSRPATPPRQESDHDDESAGRAPADEPQEEQRDAEEEPVAAAAASGQQPPTANAANASSDDDVPPPQIPKHAPPASVPPKAAPRRDDDSDADAGVPSPPVAAPAPAPKKAAPAPKPAPKAHKKMFDDSDDDTSASSAPNSLPRGGGPLAPAVAAAAKRAPPSASLFAAANDGSDSDDGGAVRGPKAVAAPQRTAPPPKAASKAKASMFADTDSEDDAPAAVKRPAGTASKAPTAAPGKKKAMPVAKGRGMFAESEESDA